jgi:hypothetical protein
VLPVGKKVIHEYHYFAENVTLCSYWNEGQSPVSLLSTQHGSQQNSIDCKPSIVAFYNSTRFPVDSFDKLVRTYLSKRKCRRWPYTIVMNLFDAWIITSRLLYNNGPENHYTFKREFSYELCMPLKQKSVAPHGLRVSFIFRKQLVRLVHIKVDVIVPKNKRF